MRAAQLIYIYELLDPEVYRRGVTALVELFKRWTGSPSEERLYEVSPAGMIYFADHSELWRNSEEPRALPLTAEDAIGQAERFLADIRSRFDAKESKAIRRSLQVCPVPAGVERIDAVAVLHPRLGLIDHWLCRFAIKVEAFPWSREDGHVDEEPDEDDSFHHIDRSKPLRVHDALLEVRIGSKWPGTDRYRIIGFNQRWRPFKTGGRIATELLAAIHEDEEGHDHADSENEQAPELVYVLDADSQRYLAPYYATPSGHHLGYQPASAYSRVLQAIQKDGPQVTDLFLDISVGHTEQDFIVHWSHWRPDTLAEKGIEYKGTGRMLPNGLVPAVYNVIADVIDKSTGQTKRHQQVVYAGALPASIEQILRNEAPAT